MTVHTSNHTTEAFKRWAYATAARYAGPDDRDDLAQEALLAIEQTIQNRPNVGAKLLTTIGTHAMIGYLRAGKTSTGSREPGTRKYRPTLRPVAPDYDDTDVWGQHADDPTPRIDVALDVAAALSNLPVREQTMALMYAAGYDRKSIAERVGYATVKGMDKRLVQVFGRLRESLALA